MKFSNRNLSYTVVLELLNEAETSFVPPLSQNIPFTVEEYARKLSDSAQFIICENNDDIIGFLAYYENHEGQFAYIPQIWVSDDHQRQGIGSMMVRELVSLLPNDIDSIRLEVRRANEKALTFYLKSNYYIVEEKDGRYLMQKSIDRR